MSLLNITRLRRIDVSVRLFTRSRHSAGRLVKPNPLQLGKYTYQIIPHWHWPELAKYLIPTVVSPWVSRLPLPFQSMDTQFDRIDMECTAPVEGVRGMKTLNRSAFQKTIQIPGLKVPVNSVGQVGKSLKKSLFQARGVKSVANLAESDPDYNAYRLFLFDPDKYPDVESLSAEETELLKSCHVDLTSWKLYDMQLTYENWTYSQILKMVLPKESDSVGGFSQIGHIVHLNLRDELLDYKEIIGEVLLDKIPTAETVVNKINTIDNTFRNFQMEVLAGEPNFMTTAKEHGCSFYMDFSKVYWNSRLATEHKRIIDQVNTGDVVYDVFAGVGPFAIPAAKKRCTVHANDLNPESYKWLQHNVKLNKVKGEMHTYNLDGRDFIKQVVRQDLLARWQDRPGGGEGAGYLTNKIHIVMNLPALAVEFLDVFPGLLADMSEDSLNKSMTLPMVHCYCFSKAENPAQDAKDMAANALAVALPEDCQVRHVRNVAPGKEMMCVVFQLQKHLLLGHNTDKGSEAGVTGEVHIQETKGNPDDATEADQQEDEGASPPEKKFKEDTCLRH